MVIKQIYIPSLNVKGTYIEEIGGGKDKVIYPGKSLEVELTIDDFENAEEYHNTLIAITRAVKNKLTNENASS
jgi:hypothetical protein